MRHVAIIQSSPNLAPRGLITRPGRRSTTVYAFKKDGKSGIHDPAGPGSSWGSGEGKARQEKMAQEEGFRVGKEDLVAKDIRSDQKKGSHLPGHSAVDRPAVVSAELQEMAQEKVEEIAEKADEELKKADEEYEHMSKTQKWWMELKNALYSFLKSGYEPL